MNKVNLRQARKQAGLKLEYVAKQLCITLDEVRSWEAGKGSPKMEQGMYLSMLYNMPISNINFSLEAQMEE